MLLCQRTSVISPFLHILTFKCQSHCPSWCVCVSVPSQMSVCVRAPRPHVLCVVCVFVRTRYGVPSTGSPPKLTVGAPAGRHWRAGAVHCTNTLHSILRPCDSQQAIDRLKAMLTALLNSLPFCITVPNLLFSLGYHPNWEMIKSPKMCCCP